MMIRFIQANLNHCRVAQDLLYQYMVKEKVDIAVLSDPHRIDSTASWYADCGQQRAAIYIPGSNVTIGNLIQDTEFGQCASTEFRCTAAMLPPTVRMHTTRDFSGGWKTASDPSHQAFQSWSPVTLTLDLLHGATGLVTQGEMS